MLDVFKEVLDFDLVASRFCFRLFYYDLVELDNKFFTEVWVNEF